MNYYPKYPGDYLRDTAHLTLMEHGAYSLMLDYYYSSGRAFPRERRLIYRMLRAETGEERAAVDAVLEQFWFETADGWENQKANQVIEQVAERREKRRKAAQIRWERQRAAAAEAGGDGMQVHMQMQSNQNQSQNQSQNQIQKPEKEDAVRAREAAPPDHFHAQYDPAFKTFMKELQATYPEHAGRSNWRKAEEGVVALLNDGYTHDRIRGAVMRKRAFHEAKGDLGTEFVTNPGNFFADPENIDNLWRPPAQQQRKTRKEEAAEHNWQTLQALRRGADEAGGPGRVQQGDSGGGGVSRPQIASNGS